MSQVSPEQANGTSTQSFLTALVSAAAFLAVEAGVFLFLRQRFKRVYSPRTYLPPPDKRAKEPPHGILRWLADLISTIPSKDIIRQNGLDAYMYVRFLRMLMIIFGVYTLATWIILFPVDSAGIPGSKSNGINQFNWSNIPDDQSDRYAAHIILVWLLTLFTLWFIRREALEFVGLRQQFLISPSHSRRVEARTVLITGVPDELTTDEKALRRWASFVPGGIGKIWIYKDTKELNKDHNARLKASDKLEKAASKLLRSATKVWRKQQTKEAKTQLKQLKNERTDLEKGSENVKPDHLSDTFVKPEPTLDNLLQLVPKDKWPAHRLGTIPFTGEKVNTIEWCKHEIARINAEIPTLRHKIIDGESKPLGAVFIECNLQLGAHVLAQCVSYHKPLVMTDKWVDVNRKDIIWQNLDDGAVETRSRYIISWGLTFALIVFWSLPVSFVGLVSNVDKLCIQAHWLAWLCKLPVPVPGIIQGVLPPVLLAVLWILLPIVLRKFAIYECKPRWTIVDTSVYKRFYLFLIIHGFLIVTLSSSLIATIPQIVKTPTDAVSLLASKLPNASVFFLTYMVTQGFAGAVMAVLQIGPLIMHFVKKKFFGQTPRQAFQNTFSMPTANISLLLPRMSLLATIGMAYSILSPIINGLALVTYCMFFIAWKFLFTYVFDQPDEFETGGLYFPICISNLFTGLYIEQIVLAVLFFLKAGTGTLSFLIEGILMLVLLVITFAVHILINKSIKPAITYLPMSLATRKLQERYERRKKHELQPELQGQEDEEDLFDRHKLKSIIRRKVTKIKEKVLKEDEKSKSQDSAKASGSLPFIAGTSRSKLVRSDSASSRSSADSKKDKKRSEDELAIAPAARALRDSDDLDSDDDDQIDEHEFDPPSTYEDARWIWLPHDDLGFSAVLLEFLKTNDGASGGIAASDIGATMNTKGTVEVHRNPPDEDWDGGYDK